MLASRLCFRAAARPSIISKASRSRLQPPGPAAWHAQRIFVTTPRHRKDAQRIQTVQQEAVQQKQPAEESVKPEDAKKAKAAEPASKNDPLLAEQTVSNKEQRKADWAIIKDMAHYLWPKDDFGTRFRVGLSVGLLIGAKVRKDSSLSSMSSVLIAFCRSSMYKCHSTSNISSTP